MVSKALKSLQFSMKSEMSQESPTYLVQRFQRCWTSWLITGLLKIIIIIKTIKTKQKAECRSIPVGMAY